MTNCVYKLWPSDCCQALYFLYFSLKHQKLPVWTMKKKKNLSTLFLQSFLIHSFCCLFEPWDPCTLEQRLTGQHFVTGSGTVTINMFRPGPVPTPEPGPHSCQDRNRNQILFGFGTGTGSQTWTRPRARTIINTVGIMGHKDIWSLNAFFILKLKILIFPSKLPNVKNYWET